MDRIFQLSSYQQDIVDFVKFQKGNLLVDAKAGSGKTSTLIMLADELTKCGNKCLFLRNFLPEKQSCPKQHPQPTEHL